MPRRLRILMVSPEALPAVCGGGLSETVGALATALVERGHKVDVLTPYSPKHVSRALPPLEKVTTVDLAVGGRVIQAPLLVPQGQDGPLRSILVDVPEFFHRDGIYGDGATEYADNCARFVALARAAIAVGPALKVRYDVINAHDWPAALALYYLREQKASGSAGVARAGFFTIHNLGYQGNFWGMDLPLLGLGPEHLTSDRLEFFGKVSFLKGGLVAADRLTTVSPTYAREIVSPEGGMGMDGVLRGRTADLTGILSGVDVERWNPSTDASLVARYADPTTPERRMCRVALEQQSGLTPGGPLFAFIGAMSLEKGADVLLSIAPDMIKEGMRLLVVTDDEEAIGKSLQALADEHPGSLRVQRGITPERIRQTIAGADFLLMPSRVEPFSVLQMASMKYGAVSVVRRTGGLRDVVTDVDANPTTGTGVAYVGEGPAPLWGALQRAASLYRDVDRYTQVQQRAGAVDISFTAGAAKYEALYLEAIEKDRE